MDAVSLDPHLNTLSRAILNETDMVGQMNRMDQGPEEDLMSSFWNGNSKTLSSDGMLQIHQLKSLGTWDSIYSMSLPNV